MGGPKAKIDKTTDMNSISIPTILLSGYIIVAIGKVAKAALGFISCK